MATATKQARTTAKHAVAGVPSQFVVFESNSGEYRWDLLSEAGATLAQSVAFASFEEAEAGAAGVRDGASSTRLEARPVARSVGAVAQAPRSHDKTAR